MSLIVIALDILNTKTIYNKNEIQYNIIITEDI